MKGNEIIDQLVRAELPDTDEVRKACVRQSAPKRRRETRPRRRRALALSAAAAAACLILGVSLLTPGGGGAFSVKAYAAEQQADGSLQLQEVDVADAQPASWSGYVDGEAGAVYVNIGLRCVGENIESVEFSTDSGFFAKQYIGTLSQSATSSDLAVSDGLIAYNSGNQVTLFGTEFDRAGGTITLDRDTADQYLVFWGTDYTESSAPPDAAFPKSVTVHATATFSGGKTEEKDVTIDLSGPGSFVYNPSEEEKAEMQKENEAYTALLQSIPLDQCQVVPDSVQTLSYGDTFTYSVGDPRSTGYLPITRESMDAAVAEGLFDAGGVFRISSNLYDMQQGQSAGGDGYIAVLERGGDGSTFTGMVYRVPEQLILENMN